MLKLPSKNYGFIDGSFNPETKTYGWGGFLVDQNGHKEIIQGCGKKPEVAKMRNVAGEIYGAMNLLSLVFSKKMKKVHLYYDYDGIANWPTGVWRCRNSETSNYKAFVNTLIKMGIKIYWHHVKSHAGILENEEADRLAKKAVGLGGDV